MLIRPFLAKRDEFRSRMFVEGMGPTDAGEAGADDLSCR